MIRFAISLASLILVTGFGLAGFALTQVLIANFSVEGRISWIAVAQSVSPFILAAGVLVAWAALQSNIRHSLDQKHREESAFFFRECKENFEEIIMILAKHKHGGDTRANLRQDLEHIAAILSDVDELSTNISDDPFVRAFQRRREDLKRRMYDLFDRLTLDDLTRLGEDRSVEDIRSHLERPTKAESLNHSADTPFPSGVPARTLHTILDFFHTAPAKAGQERLSLAGIRDARLGVIRHYLDLCRNQGDAAMEKMPKTTSL